MLIKYRSIITVGLWYYNQSGVTELLIMRALVTAYFSSLLKLAVQIGPGVRRLWANCPVKTAPFPSLKDYSYNKNLEDVTSNHHVFMTLHFVDSYTLVTHN